MRYAIRRVLQNPGFSLIVVLTLALGIGATTAIFSIVHAVLLRPLPYPHPERLLTAFHYYASLTDLEASFAVPTYRDVQERMRIFDAIVVGTGGAVNLTGRGQPERLPGVQVTADYFEVFGVGAALGRTFAPDEDQEGRHQVVVLSHGLWTRRFGADPGLVGRTLVLDGEPHQVIGVMPAGFREFGFREAELWRPLPLKPDQFAPNRRTSEFLQMYGRLKPGITQEQAAREFEALARQLKADYPDAYPPGWTIRSRALADQGKQTLRPALLVLLGAVGLVLLIACANLANLLLARSAGRSRELAIRSAIGAGRWDLMRQLLAESLVLSLLGGAVGTVLAYGIVRGLVAWNPSDLPWIEDVSVDLPVLMFALALAVATGLLFGVLPAFYASNTDLQHGLREGGRTSADGPKSQRARRILVVAEIALALTLLAGAGLLLRSFERLQQVSPGFDPSNLLTFTVSLPDAKYPTREARAAFWDRLLPALESVPGVEAVAATSVLPFGGGWSTGSFTVEGHQPPRGQPGPWGDIRIVNPDYHRAMRIRLIAGRHLEPADRPDTRRVAVVDEELVRRYWPNENPLGKRITFDNLDRTASEAVNWIEVVGVVAHTAHEGLDAEPRVQVYLPYTQRALGFFVVAVRTAGDPRNLTGAVRSAVLSVDPEQPISRVRTMDELMETAVGQRRLSTVLLASFAGLALLLAALGIYGVMSYDVERRTQEVGVRMALGACRRDVLALVMWRGLRLAAAGLALGVLGAAAATRLLESQLYGVEPTDPATFASVSIVLAGVAAVATLVPALRATWIQPVEALRCE